ncbi:MULTISPECIES: hypothetical protein [Myroides]|uniref:Uncharacterized protein n=1 Tax=Myroides albus TaxID=2562892 RepID=A0A6I3LN77_9FLAO|nr:MULTISPECIES: hypothetical protein [Myroides]MTG98760.1 hypothetical protein [Myroides albus]MVX35889.1 hypothetical protein [Myroides sp. LoEW2-1]UVD79923.1 hypothetical protein NWE55_01125 [Myroides albus]
MSKHYITCQKCKTENLNSDYCVNCGEVINLVLRRQLEQQKVTEERIQKEINAEPTKFEKFTRKMLKHQNPLIRITALIIHSIWIVGVSIMAGIAYIIGFIAA